jgi:hypothetical protein
MPSKSDCVANPRVITCSLLKRDQTLVVINEPVFEQGDCPLVGLTHLLPLERIDEVALEKGTDRLVESEWAGEHEVMHLSQGFESFDNVLAIP